jgi:DNA polymerase-3 subunit delta'
VNFLQQTLDSDALTGLPRGPRHAYLFVGPAQIGKSTLARVYGQALLCVSTEARPCGACRACLLAQKGGHPDLRLVQPRDKDGKPDRTNGMLRVEQAVEVVHEATLRPVEGRYKVFVVQDAHTANDGFANKLLKTLEEPPDHVVFVLTALDRNSVLPTIASRCQVMELRPLPPQTVREALTTQWNAPADQAELFARLSNGRLGWALDQLSASDSMAHRQQQLEQLWRLIDADRIMRLKMAADLAPERDDRQLFGMLALWTTWWRDVLLAQSGCVNQCSHIDQRAEIERQALRIAPEAVRGYLHTLHRVEGYLRHTVNTRLALDVLLLQVPRPVQ